MVQRVLFVHAHPDDETLSTGATIATLVDRGDEVTVLTCTRGELGEIVADDLTHLNDEGLAAHRELELAEALTALGGTEHFYLGAGVARWQGRTERRYRDSGMRWGTSGPEALDPADPRSLIAAEPGEVASDIAAVLLAVHPDVVVSYAADGGYGHPDHILVHEATRTAASVIGVPLYVIGAGSKAVVVDPAPVLERKRKALQAHRSQLTVDGERVIVSPLVSEPVAAIETFHRLRPAGNSFAEYGIGARIATYVLVVVLGAFVGATVTIVSDQTIDVGGVPVPWGAIAAIVIGVCFAFGLLMVFQSRLVALCGVLGVLAGGVALAAAVIAAGR